MFVYNYVFFLKWRQTQLIRIEVYGDKYHECSPH